MITVEQKLAAQNQQPNPECETQRPARNARAEERSEDRADNTTRDQLQEQLRACAKCEPVRAAAQQRIYKADENIGSHHMSRR